MRRTTTLTVALVTAATTLTTTGLVVTGAGSALASTPTGTHRTTTDRAEAAAGYLARHLTGKHDDHYTTVYAGKTYADYGTTADAVLSMSAAGAALAAAERATDYLAAHVDDYAVTAYGTYPGAVAKLMLVATAQHRHVHDFGGVDLVDELTATEGAEGAPAGEYQQNPGHSGASSDEDRYIVSQALPVLALAVAGGSGQPDAAAVSYLAGQQCANGGFASLVRNDTSTDCTDNDVDATGYAVQALLAAGANDAATAGLDWLVHARHDNGGYGTTAAERSNANSTAVAVQALIAGERKIRPSMRWLHRHQVGCDAKPGRIGAVRFQHKYDGTALRATSQAGAALARTPLATVDAAGGYRAAPYYDC